MLSAVSVIPFVAATSFIAAIVRPPLNAVRLTEPLSVSMPFTPQTVVTVKPSASTNVTSPLDVSMARCVTFVEASVNATAPPATTARSLTMIPPALAVTVEPLVKQSVVIAGESVRSMSSETVIAPLSELPMSRRLAVMLSSSASVSPRTPAASAPPRSMELPSVRCDKLTTLVPTFSVEEAAKSIASAMRVALPPSAVLPLANAMLFVMTDSAPPIPEPLVPLNVVVPVPEVCVTLPVV